MEESKHCTFAYLHTTWWWIFIYCSGLNRSSPLSQKLERPVAIEPVAIRIMNESTSYFPKTLTRKGNLDNGRNLFIMDESRDFWELFDLDLKMHVTKEQLRVKVYLALGCLEVGWRHWSSNPERLLNHNQVCRGEEGWSGLNRVWDWDPRLRCQHLMRFEIKYGQWTLRWRERGRNWECFHFSEKAWIIWESKNNPQDPQVCTAEVGPDCKSSVVGSSSSLNQWPYWLDYLVLALP